MRSEFRMKRVDCTESHSKLAIARFESVSKVLLIPQIVLIVLNSYA